MMWSWTTLIREISRTCLYLSKTKDIWENLHQTYSRAKDATQNFELTLKLISIKL